MGTSLLQSLRSQHVCRKGSLKSTQPQKDVGLGRDTIVCLSKLRDWLGTGEPQKSLGPSRQNCPGLLDPSGSHPFQPGLVLQRGSLPV